MESIAPKSFYGDILTTHTSDWARKLALLRKPEPFTDIYQEFPKQQMAIDFASKSDSLKIFSFEYERDTKRKQGVPENVGGRKYVVTTYKQFWTKYGADLHKESGKHFYEIIVENKPSKIYFDVEFEYGLNPGLVGENVIDILKKLMCEMISSVFKIELDVTDFLDLDSSTPKKFSRHLIINHNLCWFKDNIQVGLFIKWVVAQLQTMRTDPDIDSLFVKNAKDKTVFVADMAVYTKNRNFRIYGSSKIGKGIPLIVAEKNSFKFFNEEDLFMTSLICKLDHPVSLLVFEEFNIVPHLVSKPKKTDVKPIEKKMGEKTTPFSSVDEFVKTLINFGNVEGYIRSWVFFKESKIITYNIGNNRFCHNINRQHKSNHTFIVADLERNVCYQKCHDPDCSNFRSNEFPIPTEFQPFNAEKLNTDEMLLPDDVLLNMDLLQ
eukprot:TRINITY_DN2374_c0_g1_i1.p1 TRINITY_DN2374_c0_g1~~TRINITY_DN2374_c0_g1_i1.p1  ORF type:complete len:436 (-),score=94.88 TRINITY_DN2374_c0_g1_i1:207-1514(-)